MKLRSWAVPIAVLVAATHLGCPGSSGGEAPPPPTDLQLAWLNYDEFVVTWTPPSTPVDGFTAQGRIDDGPWELVADDIPPNAIGGYVGLDPSAPELIRIGMRVCSVRGGRSSEYTPEATLLRGLRPLSALTVHTQLEDVALSWTQVSAVAQEIRVERAVWDYFQGLGPYEVVATLPANASSWLDTTTAAPGVAYSYRATNVGTYQGAPTLSDPVERTADLTTTLSPPAGLGAAVGEEGVRLTWTPTSRNATTQVVERTDVASDLFGPLFTVDAATTTYLDPAPAAGGYRYRVSAFVGDLTGYASPSTPVTAYVPPPPGPWGLAQAILHVPYGDGVARDDSGGWWFARHWTTGTPTTPPGSGVWAPVADGWEAQALGATGGEYLVEPGVVLDGQGRPHVFWLLNVDPIPTTSPRMQLRHSWRDAGTWNVETIAERVFSSDNVSYRAHVAVDGAGALHVLWEATQLSGSSMLTLREYATNASGAWTIEPLPFGIIDATYALSFQLSVAPDGTAHVAVLGVRVSPREAALVHLRRGAGGWSEELVPTGALSFFDSMRLVARGADDVDLLYTRQPNGLVAPEYCFLARTAAGWGTPEVLGERINTSGHLLPGLAVSRDGNRRAALLQLPEGLALATWEAGVGWQVGRIHSTVAFDVPWLGFDAGGALDVLLPGGLVGPDGYVDRVHLRSTQ